MVRAKSYVHLFILFHLCILLVALWQGASVPTPLFAAEEAPPTPSAQPAQPQTYYLHLPLIQNAGNQAEETAATLPPDNPKKGLIYAGLRANLNGPCGAAFQVEGTEFCTHGPDLAPPAIDVQQRTEPLDVTASGALESAALCEGDGVSGNRVQVMYVRTSATPDRFNQYVTSIRQWANQVDQLFYHSAIEVGSPRRIRFVHDVNCVITVLNIVLPTTDDYGFSSTIGHLSTLGYKLSNRKYMIFMDANRYCGIGGIADDDSAGASNANNFGPSYGRIDNGCWNAMVAAHELMHNLGGVQYSAPHSSGGYHCTDEYDIMCYSDEPNYPAMQNVCTDPAADNRLDCNHDDYYHPNPPAGSYLATHWNTANNRFLINTDLIFAVTIYAPASGDRFAAGVPMTFSGRATHPSDGDLSSSLQWRSNLDGPLGSGETIQAILSPGDHTITAQATSSQNTSAQDTLTVRVCQFDAHNETELNSAIACANTTNDGTYTINLRNDIMLSAATTALNNINGAAIVIKGNGFSVDGNGHGPIFTVAANTFVDLRNITIKNGQATTGAGITNSGWLSVQRSTISGNRASSAAGIFNLNGGNLTLFESTLSDNTATGTAGGGIANSGALTVDRSTISGNRAPAAAGLFNLAGGALTLKSSTVSDNQATAGGAGALWLQSGSQATLRYSTISDNSGLIYGGIFNEGALTIQGMIIANHGNGDCTNANGTTVTDLGYNLVEDGGCISRASSRSGDPYLSALANNGGPTLTQALLSGSPALDVIPLSSCQFLRDQRNVIRPQGAGCDIGALEAQFVDNDQDGVDDIVENGAANNGDGNHDGIADRQQTHVTSLPNAVDGAYLTLEAPAGINLNTVETSPVSALPQIPDTTFPVGLVGFTIHGLTPGAAVNVTLYLPTDVTINSYYKYGRPSTIEIATLYPFGFDGTTGAEILSDRIILHLVDGQRGDDDWSANGTLVDPGGAAFTTNTTPVIAAHNATATVNEGETANNSGTISDGEGDTVTLNASVGTVVNNNDGAWSWSYATSDGPPESSLVTITADDGNGGVSHTSFFLAVNNVVPTISAVTNSGPLVNSGSATINVSASDPAGTADPLAYAFDCDNNGSFEVGPQAESSTICNFTGVGQFTVNVQVSDDDGGVVNGSTTVTVNPAGTVIATCAGYEVRQVGSAYTAAGWAGSIKVGSNSNNTINGSADRDLILGLGGNDKLDGKGGDDVICGGDGVDMLTGAAGNDVLEGGSGNDVLNSGAGDFDSLAAGDGNDVLLDGDGVISVLGDAGNDAFILALRNGWRDRDGQARFTGLAGGYGNDAVGLAILGPTRFFLDMTGDKRDNPPSPLEGTDDGLVLAGLLDPASVIIKFERRVGAASVSEVDEANLLFEGFAVDPTTLTDESGAEFLSEPAGGDEPGEESEGAEATQTNRIFLPVINR